MYFRPWFIVWNKLNFFSRFHNHYSAVHWKWPHSYNWAFWIMAFTRKHVSVRSQFPLRSPLTLDDRRLMWNPISKFYRNFEIKPSFGIWTRNILISSPPLYHLGHGFHLCGNNVVIMKIGIQIFLAAESIFSIIINVKAQCVGWPSTSTGQGSHPNQNRVIPDINISFTKLHDFITL